MARSPSGLSFRRWPAASGQIGGHRGYMAPPLKPDAVLRPHLPAVSLCPFCRGRRLAARHRGRTRKGAAIRSDLLRSRRGVGRLEIGSNRIRRRASSAGRLVRRNDARAGTRIRAHWAPSAAGSAYRKYASPAATSSGPHPLALPSLSGGRALRSCIGLAYRPRHATAMPVLDLDSLCVCDRRHHRPVGIGQDVSAHVLAGLERPGAVWGCGTGRHPEAVGGRPGPLAPPDAGLRLPGLPPVQWPLGARQCPAPRDVRARGDPRPAETAGARASGRGPGAGGSDAGGEALAGRDAARRAGAGPAVRAAGGGGR